LPQIELTVEPGFEYNHSKYQWVTKFDDELAVETFGTRYVFANIDHKTVSADIRLNWSFNPKVSLQLYAQPFFTVGNYKSFKEFAKPNSKKYKIYGENNSTINYDDDSNSYKVDPDGTGPSEENTFGNPDFNFKSVRGNAVLRWEVLPGSVLFLVWTHDKVNFEDAGSFELSRDFTNLWASEANNALLMKFSYWFDL